MIETNAGTGMVQEDQPTLAYRWADLWTTGDLDRASQVFAEDVRDHRTFPLSDIRGIGDECTFIRTIRAAFPDLRVEIEDLVVEGDRVAARVTHHGTHQGPFLGIAPTGRRISYEGTVIFRIMNGKIAERWGTVDVYGIVVQLGGEYATRTGEGMFASLT